MHRINKGLRSDGSWADVEQQSGDGLMRAWYVCGGVLAVSRGLGDFSVWELVVTAIAPEQLKFGVAREELWV